MMKHTVRRNWLRCHFLPFVATVPMFVPIHVMLSSRPLCRLVLGTYANLQLFSAVITQYNKCHEISYLLFFETDCLWRSFVFSACVHGWRGWYGIIAVNPIPRHRPAASFVFVIYILSSLTETKILSLDFITSFVAAYDASKSSHTMHFPSSCFFNSGLKYAVNT